MKVTNLKDLKNIAKGEVVELPSFSETPFVARLRQPSLVGLVANGKMPNHLVGLATALFNADNDKVNKITETQKGIKELYELMLVVADECLMEPTLKDIQEAGLELSDIQLTSIFNYSQRGSKVLQSFRD
jgi:hypothetical protein